MVKILILLASLGVLVILIRNKMKMGNNAEVKAIDTTNMVKDPICDTYVEEDTPYKLKYYDKVYSFCSEECVEKFKKQKQSESSANSADGQKI